MASKSARAGASGTLRCCSQSRNVVIGRWNAWGRALEIVDDEGRIRAAINLHPASTSHPETTILRLIDQNGRPSVKLANLERGGMLALVSDAEGNYVQLSGREIAVTKDGQRREIP